MRLIEAAEGKGAIQARGRSAVVLVEKEIARLPNQLEREAQTEHLFAPGMYVRKFYLPKGAIAAGRIHKYEHIAVVLMGTIATMNEKGESIIKAPQTFKVPAGAKRIVYGIEDSIFMTIHPNPTNETDPDKLFEQYSVATFEELKEYVIDGEFTE